MKTSIENSSVVVAASTLTVYRELEEGVVASVSGDTVAIWAIDDGEAIQLMCLSKGKSNLTVDQMITKMWG